MSRLPTPIVQNRPTKGTIFLGRFTTHRRVRGVSLTCHGVVHRSRSHLLRWRLRTLPLGCTLCGQALAIRMFISLCAAGGPYIRPGCRDFQPTRASGQHCRADLDQRAASAVFSRSVCAGSPRIGMEAAGQGRCSRPASNRRLALRSRSAESLSFLSPSARQLPSRTRQPPPLLRSVSSTETSVVAFKWRSCDVVG